MIDAQEALAIKVQDEALRQAGDYTTTIFRVHGGTVGLQAEVSSLNGRLRHEKENPRDEYEA